MSEIKIESFKHKILSFKINLNEKLLEILNSVDLTHYGMNSNNFFNLSEKDKIKETEIFKILSIDFFKILKELNYSRFSILKWWVQKYSENQYHDLHTHGLEPDLYSFVLYLDCTENSSSIIFYPPLYPYFLSENPIRHKPEKGLFIFFPSYLPHTVEINKDKSRFILSGNVKCYRDKV